MQAGYLSDPRLHSVGLMNDHGCSSDVAKRELYFREGDNSPPKRGYAYKVDKLKFATFEV
jgi:hypothetical protein